MSDEKVIYASGVRPRTNRILRGFAIKNDLTLSQLMDIFAHLVSAYETTALFSGKAGEANSDYYKFDDMVREYIERNMPEKYQRLPFLTRLFGTVLQPMTKRDLERIDRELAEEEKEDHIEIPEVDIGEDE